MSDFTGFKELYVELKGNADGPADTYIERVDGLDPDALHMIEKAAYDALANENEKLKHRIETWHKPDQLLLEKERNTLRQENKKLKETDMIWSKLSLVQISQDNERLRQANAELVESLKYIAKFGCCACEVEAENALTKHGQGAGEK